MGMYSKEAISDILSEAADLIDTHGWIRYEYGNCETGFCALGALEHVAIETHGFDGYDAYFRARDELIDELEIHGFPRNVSGFNDGYAKDKRYVTRKLRSAAKRLAEETGQA